MALYTASRSGKGLREIKKPEKVYLNNPNLYPGNKQDKSHETAADEERTATPEEIFESAYQELRSSLANA
ncbi:MAG: hypothetical protein KKD63_01855 [Proteobacteria bacterium]|nr:hypothetical protein [Desulfobulbaceae bacterium]MBU4151604.1 hypothetical protein [Pseudomonadota bacterium]